jgi:apolipoprotein N-acyltransferase
MLLLRRKNHLLPLFSGALLPLGFAPFHLPGFATLGIAIFFYYLTYSLPERYTNAPKNIRNKAFLSGVLFGLGFMGVGVSWVFVSIHEYGHLNDFISGIITLVFVAYLSLYTGILAYFYHRLAIPRSKFWNCALFSALWCLGEYARANFFTGFPWLLLGHAQMDTPLNALLPIVGVYGASFVACLSACFLAMTLQRERRKQIPWLCAFVGILIVPLLYKNTIWVESKKSSVSVGVIQANMSMQDKWDERVFWQVVRYYTKKTDELLGKTQLIVLPESAIPAPSSYVTDLLDSLHQKGLDANTSILLGVPEELSPNQYFNSMIGLGKASGTYRKRHLVPFGEFIPHPFQTLMNWLSIPLADISKGGQGQSLVWVKNHAIATLICYEIAYPNLLREQLPEAQWIVSISDDGWFGHSFAMYQQLQIAQVLSAQAGRYQVVANNDGLSSVLDFQGQIVDSLPAYKAGILKSRIYPATGSTPWVAYGDNPMLIFILAIIFVVTIRQFRTLRIATQISQLDNLR